jgi:hypothetical protein
LQYQIKSNLCEQWLDKKYQGRWKWILNHLLAN